VHGGHGQGMTIRRRPQPPSRRATVVKGAMMDAVTRGMTAGRLMRARGAGGAQLPPKATGAAPRQGKGARSGTAGHERRMTGIRGTMRMHLMRTTRQRRMQEGISGASGWLGIRIYAVDSDAQAGGAARDHGDRSELEEWGGFIMTVTGGTTARHLIGGTRTSAVLVGDGPTTECAGACTRKVLVEKVSSGSCRGSASRPGKRGCRVPKRGRSLFSSHRARGGAEAAPPSGPACR
jgi:hypothetical protein